MAFWEWNDRSLQPARHIVSTDRTTYETGFPSIFQTSEHLRFDLADRPRSIKVTKSRRLGIGHTVRASRNNFYCVWSIFYTWVRQSFSSSCGLGKSVLNYKLTTLCLTITRRDSPHKWGITVTYPPGWEEDENVLAFYHNEAPDKWNKLKIELNFIFHCILLGVRFPGYIEDDVNTALNDAMKDRRDKAHARLQSSPAIATALQARLLGIIQYYEELMDHLKEQSRLCEMKVIDIPKLEDLKAETLPAGSRLHADEDDDSDEDEDRGSQSALETNSTYRQSWRRQPKKRKRIQKKASKSSGTNLTLQQASVQLICQCMYTCTRTF